VCLDRRECYTVEVGLFDETTESQTKMGWALRLTGNDTMEPIFDRRPVSSGLVPSAGEKLPSSCGFASHLITTELWRECPITCTEGEDFDKWGPVCAPGTNPGEKRDCRGGGGRGGKGGGEGRLFTKNGGCKNGSFLHELVFVGEKVGADGTDLGADPPSPSGLDVTLKQGDQEILWAPFDDKNLNPAKSKERISDDSQYLCLRRNKCYSAEIVPEDEGASVPVVAKRSDLEGAAGWEVRRVLTGNTKKKAGKYGKTLASGSLFGTLEEGSFGNGGGSALEGCDFALQPKKGGAQNDAAAAPQCEKSTCGLPVADNIFDSSIAN